MLSLDQENRFPRWAEILSVLLVVAVALFPRLYGHDPGALLGFEEMDLFSGVDFVLGFVYRLDQSGYPVRDFWQACFPGRIPPLEVHSPFMNRPWVPAQEYNAVMAAHTSGSIFVPRPLGANLGTPFQDQVYSGYPKTFHNLGIQRFHPGTPAWFLGGLATIFLGNGITNFSLNLLPPIVAFRLPSMLFSTVTCLAVFYVACRWFRNSLVALLAALFLALEPLFLKVSRDAKIDASLALFTFAAVWTYWEARERRNRRWLVLTGLLIGLGLATKIQAIILPIVLIGWDVLRNWLNDDLSRLRLVKPLFLAGFSLLILGAPVLWVGYQVIPHDMMIRAFENSRGFVVNVVGSWLFILLVCGICAWPFRKSILVLKEHLRHLRSLRIVDVIGVKTRHRAIQLVLDLGFVATIALLSFVLLVPNVWGSPLKGVLGWLGFWKGDAATGFRVSYFVTRTVYLPFYYYLAMVLIKTSLLFLVALVIGIGVGVRWLKHHRLRESLASRALLIMFVFSLSYLLLASSNPSLKEPKELASVFPFFAMWAGLGMTWLVSYVTQLLRRSNLFHLLATLAAGWIVVVGLFNTFAYVPYLGLFYNRLVGSAENGARIEWLNFDVGSGYERAARYISQVYGDDKKVLGSGEIGWMNMSYPNVYTVDPLPPGASFRDVYELVQGYDLVVIHSMETQRRPHFVFHQFFARQTPAYRIVINGVEVIQIFDVHQVQPLAGSEVDQTAYTTRLPSVH